VAESRRAEPVHQRADQEPGEVDRPQQVDQPDGLQRHPALQQDRDERGVEERVTDVRDEEQRRDQQAVVASPAPGAPRPRSRPTAFD
jgi:hypothetical protein